MAWCVNLCGQKGCAEVISQSKCKVIIFIFDTSKFKSVLKHHTEWPWTLNCTVWVWALAQAGIIPMCSWAGNLLTHNAFLHQNVKVDISKLNIERGVVTLWWTGIPFWEGLGLTNHLSLCALETRNTLLRPGLISQ